MTSQNFSPDGGQGAPVSLFRLIGEQAAEAVNRLERDGELVRTRVDVALAQLARVQAEQALVVANLVQELERRLAMLPDAAPTSVIGEQTAEAINQLERGGELLRTRVDTALAQQARVQAETALTAANLVRELEQRLATLQDGAPGEPGPPGPPGPPGNRGEPGMLLQSIAWTPDTVFYECQVVTHDGETFQARRDTAQQPPGEHWLCLAARGAPGQAGAGFTLRGTYDPLADYTRHDVVMLGGSSFAAKADQPGACPGDGWQLFASCGSRGPKGLPGDRGGAGPAGPPGEPATVVVIEDEG